ncbi:uncharacterized protein LOC135846485 isoform X2 [Planococcus citri]|uniref:uncharacterized protein LOC135846485 isoform X2 n=1 Tax=Planococcus citri TaxID=170843 RepID=UPI0031F854E9
MKFSLHLIIFSSFIQSKHIVLSNKAAVAQITTDDNTLSKSIELPADVLSLMGNFNDSAKLLVKKCFNQQYRKEYRKGFVKSVDTFFLNFFECAVHTSKLALELYGVFEDEFKKSEVQEIMKKQSPKLPFDILDIFKTRDLPWIHTVDDSVFELFLKSTPSATPSITEKSLPKARQNKTAILEKFFRGWYYILTVRKYDCDGLKLFHYKLDDIFEHNAAHFIDKTSFYSRCAANLARSYMQLCSLHHNWLPTLRMHLFTRKHTEREFFADILLDFLPQWYLSEEQIVFLNIIRSTGFIDQAIQALKTVCIQNRWTGTPGNPEHPDWTYIFYDESSVCRQIDLVNGPTIKSPNHIGIVVPTRIKINFAVYITTNYRSNFYQKT